ncbi:MarR family winged helix-turn-helix transcriptional regulator [Nocardia stercoris]|uniref:MarR family transcriptional regulator n=1 Tax=Nocardia stercoris TaxID=2483361 RepID=A0A3M2KYI2_9NOCA|nr:MarR family transcriptional regulator [Nocardia stercoris]RMI29696.1 MarR family transcriptional regulator [Nocardia stercoris]
MQESQRIDHLLGQWADERPDVDTGSMALVTRLQRVVQLIDLRLDALAAEYGVHRSEGDVLFALRRAGAPYRLSPSRLAESLLVTTGTMTNRLDRLEKRGYIRRIPNPEDRRGILVELTDVARELTDTALEQHVGNQREMLAVLSVADRRELTRLLNTLIDHLGA